MHADHVLYVLHPVVGREPQRAEDQADEKGDENQCQRHRLHESDGEEMGRPGEEQSLARDGEVGRGAVSKHFGGDFLDPLEGGPMFRRRGLHHPTLHAQLRAIGAQLGGEVLTRPGAILVLQVVLGHQAGSVLGRYQRPFLAPFIERERGLA